MNQPGKVTSQTLQEQLYQTEKKAMEQNTTLADSIKKMNSTNSNFKETGFQLRDQTDKLNQVKEIVG